MPRKQAQTRAANSSALKKLVTQAVAPKKPRTPKQLAALQKAAATKKQKAQELSIRRGHDASLKAERQVWQEFLDIIAELAYDGSKFDKAKVMSEAMNDAMDHLEEQDPLFCLSDPGSAAKLHRKRCELAHAKMQEYRAEKARLKRKRRRGISFR